MATYKNLVADYWQQLDAADSLSAAAVFQSILAPDTYWHAHQPVGDARGISAVVGNVWQPLLESFAGMQREVYILLEGISNGRIDGDIARDGKHWVTGTGVFHGRFEKDYCGIPASGEPVELRWGEFCRFENDRIVETFFLVDLVDLTEQIGLSVLPVAKGSPCIYRRPAADDGLIHYEVDNAESAYSLAHIRKFIFDGLNAYDQDDLQTMGMADYFHENAQWYGPGGIGLCNGFAEFETLHQKPWLYAFPDRSVQNLDALFAEGAYSAAPGWAGVLATHTGAYLDCPPTRRSIAFNGLDWWKREGERYIENWVFVDMVHLFDQFGVDLLASVRKKT